MFFAIVLKGNLISGHAGQHLERLLERVHRCRIGSVDGRFVDAFYEFAHFWE